MRTWRRSRALVVVLISLILTLTVGLGPVGAEDEVHEVCAGETLLDIGAAYGMDPDLIAQFNGISDPCSLLEGQKVVIPDLSGFQVDVDASVVYVMESWGGESGIITPDGLPPGSPLTIADLTPPGKWFETMRPSIAILEYFSRPVSAHRSLLCPAFGPISTYFGERGLLWRSGVHEGLDIGARYGTIVRAADRGVVVEDKSDEGRGYGAYINLDHGKGVRTLYAHLSRVYVKPGERVRSGQVIGLVGSTGFSDGPHLHFEVRMAGKKVDPLLYLPVRHDEEAKH